MTFDSSLGGKYSPMELLVRFYGSLTSQELIQFNQLDWYGVKQLASAIARKYNVREEDCNFKFVPYD